MKRIALIPGEYYHVYNRGVDKRSIFQDKKDLAIFLAEMKKLNTLNAQGGLRAIKFKESVRGSTSYSEKLVDIVAFCLNPNHFHMIITPLVDGGVQKFMQRLGTGYTMYFNEKYERSGALFQGRYKVKHIPTNEYLLYLGAYVNMNYIVHGYGKEDLFVSSLPAYVSHETKKDVINPDIIKNQYQNPGTYKEEALTVVSAIQEKRSSDKKLEKLLFE